LPVSGTGKVVNELYLDDFKDTKRGPARRGWAALFADPLFLLA
jgi:hypothetical protein